LQTYIAAIREAQMARGSGKLGMGDQEHEVRDAARRSIVADQPIARGTRITRAMLALKRPGTGIPPGEMQQVIGKTAASNIPTDTLLSWDMVR
jgi:sialic acid synthase SpsE